MTGRAEYLDLGNWNVVCYECGRKRKASSMKKHWQGYYVCPEHWESRQPQDFVRAVPDVQTVPWAQPPSDDILFLCDLWSSSPMAGFGEADCMHADVGASIAVLLNAYSATSIAGLAIASRSISGVI